MARRYLFGPVTKTFAEQKLKGPRQAGQCLCFGQEDTVDIPLVGTETWDEVCQRLPSNWVPDFLALYLPYTTIPSCLLTAPVPIVALAPEWPLLWHYYRQRLRQCDLIVTDPDGQEKFEREKIGPAIAAHFGGCPHRLLEAQFSQDQRDIDILYLANLNPAVHPQRGKWLLSLAKLAERWRVVIQSGIFEEEYAQMLRRARIIISHNRPGGLYRRVFEAAAAGALVFQEAGNGQLDPHLQKGKECVHFTSENLVELLEHYLENESERKALAEAARGRVSSCSFEDFWGQTLELIEQHWPALVERQKNRWQPSETETLLLRCWQALGSPSHPDTALLTDLPKTLEKKPGDAALHHAYGLALACSAPSGDAARLGELVEEHFRRAVSCEPRHLVAGTNLAVALAFSGQRRKSIDQAKLTLARLHDAAEPDFPLLDAGHFPPSFDWIRMEWERAAWSNAGEAPGEKLRKRDLLRWRLHSLLLELTGDLVHGYEAFHAAPDLPPAGSGLGCALARTGHADVAVPYLQQALAKDPLDRNTAFILYQSLGATGDRQAQGEVARQRCLLSLAAPQLVPMEEWFQYGPAKLEAIPLEPSREGEEKISLPGWSSTPNLVCAQPAQVPNVSLSMIVKNEEANLPHCLTSVADLVNEIIVVDTGSSDRTKEIAGRLGAKVIDFPWVDSFAAARNASLNHVTGKWVLWLDADDRIDEENRRKMKSLFQKLGDEMDAYVVKIRSMLDSKRSDPKLLDQVRIFRNHPQIRWQYRIHEQILPAVNRVGGDVRWTDLVIDHCGYQDQDLRRQKLLRNLRLLELEESENPGDPFNLFNLGWTTLDLGRPLDALPYLQASLKGSTPNASIVRKLFVLLTQTHLHLNQPKQALEVCQQGRERFPEDGELLFEEASLLRNNGILAEAENRLLQLMNLQSGPYFASVDAGLRTHRARHLLGLVFLDQKKWIEAEAQFRAAVRERPDFVPAWLALGDLYLDQQREAMLEKTARELEAAQAPLDAAILRARACLARKEYPLARQILEPALAQFPQAHGAWVLLSHVLISEAKDWDAAEKTLRRILSLNPANAEARHNLEVLLTQKAHSRTA